MAPRASKKKSATLRNLVVVINAEDMNYDTLESLDNVEGADAFYHLRDTDDVSAVRRALRFHAENRPDSRIESILVYWLDTDNNDHHFIPDSFTAD